MSVEQGLMGDEMAAHGFAAQLGTMVSALAGAIAGSLQHVAALGGLTAVGAGVLFGQSRRRRAECLHRQEVRLRKELLAYLLFQGSPRTMAEAEFGRQLSRLIAVRSSFGRAALMLRGRSGTLEVAGSAGMDDLTVEALHRWASSLPAPVLPISALAGGAHAGEDRAGRSSFRLQLERRAAGERTPLTAIGCGDVYIVPIRTARELLGALVVCAQPRAITSSGEPREFPRTSRPLRITLPVSDMLEPLEALALRLATQLTAPENVTPLWPAASTGHRPSPRREGIGLVREHTGQASSAGKRRRRLDGEAEMRSAESTAAALERIRQIVDPGLPPVHAVAGSVSGWPPARLWRIPDGVVGRR